MKQAIAKLAEFVLRRRGITAAVLGLLLAVGLIGLGSLSFDFSPATFFGRGDPAVEHLNKYKKFWGTDDDVLLIIGSVTEGDFFTPARMGELNQLAKKLERVADVVDVDALPTLPRFVSSEEMVDLSPLFDTMPKGAEDSAAFKQWRAEVLGNEMFVPYVISRDARFTLLAVELSVSSDQMLKSRPIVERIDAFVRKFEREGKLGIHYELAGIPAARVGVVTAMVEDQQIFVPLSTLLMGLGLLLIFRSFHGIVVPLVAATLPAVMVFGLMGHFGQPIGLLSQTYFTLLPVIAVADAIHLLTRFHEELRNAHASSLPLEQARSLAITRAMKHIGVACFLTSLTTGIGFLSLLAARMPVLHSFGIYAAAGIGIAYGTVLLIIPLLLSLTRPKPTQTDTPAHSRVEATLGRWAEFAVTRPMLILAATAAIIAACIAGGYRVVVDNNLTEMLAKEHPTTAANRAVDANLGGVLNLELDLEGKANSLSDPAILKSLLAFETWLLKQPEVRSVTSPATFVARLHKLAVGPRKIPDSPEAVAQLYLIAEGQKTLDRVLNSDRSRGRLIIRTGDKGGRSFERFSDKIQKAVDQQLSGLPLSVALTGTPHVAYRGINNVTRDLRDSLLAAFIIITLIIGLLLRNVRMALICLFPNALPLLVGYGVLGWLGWHLAPITAMIFTVALAIAVDDTLHLIVRIKNEQDNGKPLREATVWAVQRCGKAVLITSVILICGFAVVGLSSFPALRSVGVLGVVVIGTALICDVLLLPALLSSFAATDRSPRT